MTAKCTCDELTKNWRPEDRAALCGHLIQCPASNIQPMLRLDFQPTVDPRYTYVAVSSWRRFDWDEDTEVFALMVNALKEKKLPGRKILKLVAKLLDENGLVVVWKDSNGNHTE